MEEAWIQQWMEEISTIWIWAVVRVSHPWDTKTTTISLRPHFILISHLANSLAICTHLEHQVVVHLGEWCEEDQWISSDMDHIQWTSTEIRIWCSLLFIQNNSHLCSNHCCHSEHLNNSNNKLTICPQLIMESQNIKNSWIR